MKIIKILLFLMMVFTQDLESNETSFDNWLSDFRTYALKRDISKNTFDLAMSNVIFLPKVIEYDRFQPEFYEDTFTYISKRTSNTKVKQGKKLYLENKEFINLIEKKYSVEKELLLALMGIETNFGTYVGKMDILSSLATLSFDARRSDFFTNELITILQLVEQGIIDYKLLYGSWAGAFGNFQFMPTTIRDYAIDHDNNNILELKTTNDSFASAANYINKIGWDKNKPCYIKVNLTKNVPNHLLNTSAKKINNKKKFKQLKKFIINHAEFDIEDNLLGAFITPDQDIIPDSKELEPAYVVFNNYEKILQWNRSLRFALAVCTLKDKFSNAL